MCRKEYSLLHLAAVLNESFYCIHNSLLLNTARGGRKCALIELKINLQTSFFLYVYFRERTPHRNIANFI